MLSRTDWNFIKIYLVILLSELIFTNINHLSAIHYITKPALLISLILFFYKTNSSASTYVKKFTLLALVFSLIGDILLMFQDKNALFFPLGLASFLIAHIMYILVFLKDRRTNKKSLLFLTVVSLYGLILLHFLSPNLGELFTPVIIYIIAILAMVTTAYLRNKTDSKMSYYLILIGAFLFIISDSILAIDKFLVPLNYSHILIMLTYGLAQLTLVLGIKNSL
ncbi:YhhN-like family protein [Formosa agariphila KMM 3901]|uniref:YhhN-like family protein n=1 Tax=Formosa agariphila (strain DSM 15362 / KCTC 12365 / LMG 23005 / KMM 3901 / M-2Alg 35-1) TaxID=1347342 RepID=T2KLE2_FORAG|nr:lysoplasmalogenase [Formosa agariphila]CDF79722.1 YhhN-like family protein [Formosa agariphila KMM 3901]